MCHKQGYKRGRKRSPLALKVTTRDPDQVAVCDKLGVKLGVDVGNYPAGRGQQKALWEEEQNLVFLGG